MYRRSSVASLITLSFRKVFHEKSFQKNYFSWIFFLVLLSFLSTPLISYAKLFKNLIILKVILCLKKEVLKMVFLFCLRSSVPPLIRGPFKNTFHEKHFSWTIFFLKKKFFFTFFSKNLFDNFYRTIRKTIFLKINLYNQKKLLGKLFVVF